MSIRPRRAGVQGCRGSTVEKCPLLECTCEPTRDAPATEFLIDDECRQARSGDVELDMPTQVAGGEPDDAGLVDGHPGADIRIGQEAFGAHRKGRFRRRVPELVQKPDQGGAVIDGESAHVHLAETSRGSAALRRFVSR